MPKLYDNIKKRRLELGMTQTELAQAVGYSDKSAIAHIESGRNDLTQSKVEAFARALRTTPGALMGWEEDEPLTALDVNLRDKTIRVNKKAVFDGGSVQIVHETKTKAGNRLVSIPDLLVDYLSICPRDRTYIAFNTDQPLNRYRWQSWWSSYMDELDLKYGVRVRQPTSKFDPVRRGGHVIQEFTPHQLRHTYCSMLYDAGVDVLTAKELMGHEDVQTTLGIYTHLSKARKAKSLDALNEYLA